MRNELGSKKDFVNKGSKEMSERGNVLERKATRETPRIHFDGQSGLLEITGASLPENPMGFYGPIIEWLREYVKSPSARTCLRFGFSYYNTSTSKIVLVLLDELEALHKQGKSVEVEWCYPEGDEDMEESGHEYISETVIPIKLCPQKL